MKIIIENSAHNSIESIFEHFLKYSTKKAIQTTENLYSYLYFLETSPYIGKIITELSNNNFRELIFRKNKHSTYRIIYYISKAQNIIYIINIISCKQNLNKFLKSNSYFKKYYNL